jgi:hypothetical protein|tara:strand:- start:601 stop:777 length:177 start_codon:yes stop_codon:yes gene_type:complete
MKKGEKIGNVIMEFLNKYPRTKPIPIGIPDSFKGYIEYTIKDHERNKESRSRYRNSIR